MIYALTGQGRGAYFHGIENVEGSLRRLAGINEVVEKVVGQLGHQLSGTPEARRYPDRTFALITAEVANNYGCLECLEWASNYALHAGRKGAGPRPSLVVRDLT